jgi:transposase
MEPRKPYPTDLRDNEWERSKHRVPEAQPGGRPAQYPEREILNGICSIVRGGCAWRLMPQDLPPWQMVFHYFWRWRKDGPWQRMPALLRGDVRAAAGQRRQTSAGLVDSQSVKTTAQGGAAALMSTSRARAVSGLSSSTRSACSWPSSSPRRVGKIVTGPKPCWHSSGPSACVCGGSGPIRPMQARWSRGARRCGCITPYGWRWSNEPSAPWGVRWARNGGWWSGPWGGSTATAACVKIRLRVPRRHTRDADSGGHDPSHDSPTGADCTL